MLLLLMSAALEREQAARAETEAALKTRDEFLAAASHELRNPLNALHLQLAGLRRAAQRDPSSLSAAAVQSRLDRTERQVSRLIRLVDTLLDVSRIKSGNLDLEYDDVDLVEITRDVILQLQTPDVAPIRMIGPHTLVGRWDRLRMDQVITNLVSNALKYGDSKPVRVSLAAEGDDAVLEVGDEGLGIPADLIPRLFARYERLVPDRRRGGFGLGLWITREIVDAFGGTIDVESRVGRGSTFRVRVPRRRTGLTGGNTDAKA